MEKKRFDCPSGSTWRLLISERRLKMPLNSEQFGYKIFRIQGIIFSGIGLFGLTIDYLFLFMLGLGILFVAMSYIMENER